MESDYGYEIWTFLRSTASNEHRSRVKKFVTFHQTMARKHSQLNEVIILHNFSLAAPCFIAMACLDRRRSRMGQASRAGIVFSRL